MTRTISPRSWTLEIPGRPVTANKQRGKHSHWSQSATATRAARHAAMVAQLSAVNAKRAPRRVEAIEVTCWQVSKDRRWLQDLGACFPAAKAAIDGLVDAGLIPDDTPEYVRRLSFIGPEIAGRDALGVQVQVVA